METSYCDTTVSCIDYYVKDYPINDISDLDKLFKFACPCLPDNYCSDYMCYCITSENDIGLTRRCWQDYKLILPASDETMNERYICTDPSKVKLSGYIMNYDGTACCYKFVPGVSYFECCYKKVTGEDTENSCSCFYNCVVSLDTGCYTTECADCALCNATVSFNRPLSAICYNGTQVFCNDNLITCCVTCCKKECYFYVAYQDLFTTCICTNYPTCTRCCCYTVTLSSSCKVNRCNCVFTMTIPSSFYCSCAVYVYGNNFCIPVCKVNYSTSEPTEEMNLVLDASSSGSIGVGSTAAKVYGGCSYAIINHAFPATLYVNGNLVYNRPLYRIISPDSECGLLFLRYLNECYCTIMCDYCNNTCWSSCCFNNINLRQGTRYSFSDLSCLCISICSLCNCCIPTCSFNLCGKCYRYYCAGAPLFCTGPITCVCICGTTGSYDTTYQYHFMNVSLSCYPSNSIGVIV